MAQIKFSAEFEGTEHSVVMDSDLVNVSAGLLGIQLSPDWVNNGGEPSVEDLECLEMAAVSDRYFYEFYGPDAKTEDAEVELTNRRAEVLPRRGSAR